MNEEMQEWEFRAGEFWNSLVLSAQGPGVNPKQKLSEP